MTTGLLISRNNKLKLHKTAINNPSIEHTSAYKRYRNTYNTLLRLSKKLYFESNLKAYENNPRKTWELLKEATKSPSSSKKIDTIVINGSSSSNPNEISEEFNRFFSVAGVNISETVNPSNIEPDDFLPPNPNPPTLTLGITSPATINSTIQNFTTKHSTDLDGISTHLLKSVSLAICTPLSHIFNLSINQGTFPTKLKKSRTVPIFKSGNPEICDNYRPISLLSSFSKILEKLVSIQLVNHLELNSLLYDHQ
jgi:hypothetical protein